MTTKPVMSITDEQIAEIERMNSELNELKCAVRYIRVDEVEALISRLRAAERNAAIDSICVELPAQYDYHSPAGMLRGCKEALTAAGVPYK